MDNQSSSRRALKPVQEQEVAEDWRGPRTRQSLLRAAETSEQRSEKAKGERLLGTLLKLFSVSERQATSQWKSARERGAETPRNRSSAIRHFE